MKSVLYIGNHLQPPNTNPSYMRTLGPLLEQEGYRVRYASVKSNKVLRLLDMLMSVVKGSGTVAIVLIDTYSTQNFYYAVLVSQLCRLLGLPYIPILHGGNLPSRLQYSPRLSRLVFQHAKVNVSPSLYLKQAFQQQGYDHVMHIPNSVSLETYPYAEKSYDRIDLLWVRSFSKIYNPNMAIRVLKALQDKGLKAGLCMVGPENDGSLKEAQALAQALGLPVQFTGKLAKEEWTKLSKHYNFFINTTSIDNMPVSVLEAMALGLPIVSTNVGGMPYLIEDGVDGLLVPNNGVDDMVDAIITLFENTELRENITANARKLAESFDWEKVKKKWQELLG